MYDVCKSNTDGSVAGLPGTWRGHMDARANADIIDNSNSDVWINAPVYRRSCRNAFGRIHTHSDPVANVRRRPHAILHADANAYGNTIAHANDCANGTIHAIHADCRCVAIAKSPVELLRGFFVLIQA